MNSFFLGGFSSLNHCVYSVVAMDFEKLEYTIFINIGIRLNCPEYLLYRHTC